MASRTHEPEPLLTPAEVASMFRVDPKTVTRWAKAGKLSAIRTLGGHRRYRESEVRALLAGIPQQRPGAGAGPPPPLRRCAPSSPPAPQVAPPPPPSATRDLYGPGRAFVRPRHVR